MVTSGKDFRRTYSAQLTFLPQCATIKFMDTTFVNRVDLAKLVAQEPLNRAEQVFVDCVTGKVEGAEGNLCVIGKARPEKPVYKGRNANVIRADLIRFFAWGGNSEARVVGNTIALCGAFVRGALDLVRVPSPYALALMNCHFSERVNVSFARFLSLNLGGSYLAMPLFGREVNIASGLDMDKIFAKCGVNLIGANIGGNFSCNGGRFKSNADKFAPNNKRESLTADRIRVGGNILLNNGFAADGEVGLGSANIGGYLDCQNGEFLKAKGHALFIDGIIAGNVFLHDGFVAKSMVRLLGANISGDLICSGGRFEDKDSYALIIDRAKIGGNLLMNANNDGARFRANGGVQLTSASVAGELDCSGGVFINPGKIAFAADGVNVGGELRMGLLINSSGESAPFVASGNVRLVAAKIGVSWDCAGGVFSDNVLAESVKVGNSLFWRGVHGKGAVKENGRGTVNLQGATADIFDYDEQSRDKFNFVLDGFVYRQFDGRKDVQSRLKWLSNRPEKMPFSPQPFEQAAKVLFATGHNHDAREVLLAKERLLTKHGKLPLWHKYFWRPLWHALAGYGYRLLWTLVWSVMFIAVGRALFDFADYSCRIAPHQPVVMALEMKYQPMRPDEECTDARRPTSVMAQKYPDYPRFDALAFSLDVFIPVFALHQESHWYPQQQEGETNFFLRWLRLWYWIQIGAGWILTSLLVLTITGLLRPRQTGGE